MAILTPPRMAGKAHTGTRTLGIINKLPHLPLADNFPRLLQSGRHAEDPHRTHAHFPTRADSSEPRRLMEKTSFRPTVRRKVTIQAVNNALFFLKLIDALRGVCCTGGV